MKNEIYTNQILSSKKNGLTIAIVDDDPFYRSLLIHQLTKKSAFNIAAFDSGEELVDKLDDFSPDIVILDYKLNSIHTSSMDGLAILKAIKKIDPNIYVVMLSSQESLQVTANSIKYGAYDYIIKSESAFLRLSEKIRQIIVAKYTKKQTVERVVLVISLIMFIYFSALFSNRGLRHAAFYILTMYLGLMGSFIYYHYSKKLA